MALEGLNSGAPTNQNWLGINSTVHAKGLSLPNANGLTPLVKSSTPNLRNLGLASAPSNTLNFGSPSQNSLGFASARNASRIQNMNNINFGSD